MLLVGLIVGLAGNERGAGNCHASSIYARYYQDRGAADLLAGRTEHNGIYSIKAKVPLHMATSAPIVP